MNRTSQEMVREQQLLGTTDPSAIQIHGARPPRAQHLARPTVAFSGVSVGARGPLRSHRRRARLRASDGRRRDAW